MHAHDLRPFAHDHAFVDAGAAGCGRALWAVTLLTLVTMMAELAVGWGSASMALWADGWHVGTHAAAPRWPVRSRDGRRATRPTPSAAGRSRCSPPTRADSCCSARRCGSSSTPSACCARPRARSSTRRRTMRCAGACARRSRPTATRLRPARLAGRPAVVERRRIAGGGPPAGVDRPPRPARRDRAGAPRHDRGAPLPGRGALSPRAASAYAVGAAPAAIRSGCPASSAAARSPRATASASRPWRPRRPRCRGTCGTSCSSRSAPRAAPRRAAIRR